MFLKGCFCLSWHPWLKHEWINISIHSAFLVQEWGHILYRILSGFLPSFSLSALPFSQWVLYILLSSLFIIYTNVFAMFLLYSLQLVLIARVWVGICGFKNSWYLSDLKYESCYYVLNITFYFKRSMWSNMFVPKNFVQLLFNAVQPVRCAPDTGPSAKLRDSCSFIYQLSHATM